MTSNTSVHGSRCQHISRAFMLGCACMLLTITGCTRTLVPTPTLYSNTDHHPYAITPPAYRSTAVDLLFVTDRKPTQLDDNNIQFGSERTHDMTFGSIRVRMGNDQRTWDELVHDSTHNRRRYTYPVSTHAIEKSGTLHDLVEGFEVDGDHRVRLSFTAQRRQQREDAQFIELVKGRLADCNRKEIDLYVHGVNTDLPYAAETLAQIWHFMGRDGVPIVYSWPAAEGALRAYAYSRESSEFTVSHLKRVIRLLTACEEVERIHIIGHSRGCDVVLAALRELHIERAASDERTPTKLDTIVLAAADIDQGVFRERVFGERVFETPRRIVLYTSSSDTAMGLADWMLDSVGRIGEFVLSVMDSSPEMQQRLSAFQSVQIIQCQARSGRSGHDYYYTNPAVLSDLIMVLRDRLDPGAENGRPLDRSSDGTWRILKSYPTFAPAQTEGLNPDGQDQIASPSPASSGSLSPGL